MAKNKEMKTSSRSRNRKIGNAITYAVLIVISIIWLFPFVGLVLQSFRSYVSEYGGMVAYLMPKEFLCEMVSEYTDRRGMCGNF